MKCKSRSTYLNTLYLTQRFVNFLDFTNFITSIPYRVYKKYFFDSCNFVNSC